MASSSSTSFQTHVTSCSSCSFTSHSFKLADCLMLTSVGKGSMLTLYSPPQQDRSDSNPLCNHVALLGPGVAHMYQPTGTQLVWVLNSQLQPTFFTIFTTFLAKTPTSSQCRKLKKKKEKKNYKNIQT